LDEHEHEELALEQLQVKQALPPVQSRGVPPVQAPLPSQVWPMLQ
jgi:hypothetical protein